MSDEVKINESELETAVGGNGGWQQYAKGTFVNYVISVGQKLTIYPTIIR